MGSSSGGAGGHGEFLSYSTLIASMVSVHVFLSRMQA